MSMKKTLGKTIALGAIVTTLGLGLGCSKPDFIKIKDAGYGYTPIALEKNVAIAGSGEYLMLKLDLEGFDKDGIREVYCYVDGEYYNSTNILKWITEGKPENIKSGSIKRLDRWIGVYPKTRDNSHSAFKKGKHTLRTVLEDYEGNKLENSYIYEVK